MLAEIPNERRSKSGDRKPESARTGVAPCLDKILFSRWRPKLKNAAFYERVKVNRYRNLLVTACLIVVIAVTAESSPNLGLSFATCVGADPVTHAVPAGTANTALKRVEPAAFVNGDDVSASTYRRMRCSSSCICAG
jgi:hypothetical protein